MSDDEMQYEDEFTNLVENELEGKVVFDEHSQFEMFTDVYAADLEEHPSAFMHYGRTFATDMNCQYIYQQVLDAMVAAIERFCPGHTDVKLVPDIPCLSAPAATIELFQGKSEDGADQLFIFELLEVEEDVDTLSMIGPLDLNETGLLVPGSGTIAHQLRGMEGVGLIQVFNGLALMRQEHLLKLERRSDLPAAAILDEEVGPGSIGAETLALVSGI